MFWRIQVERGDAQGKGKFKGVGINWLRLGPLNCLIKGELIFVIAIKGKDNEYGTFGVLLARLFVSFSSLLRPGHLCSPTNVRSYNLLLLSICVGLRPRYDTVV